MVSRGAAVTTFYQSVAGNMAGLPVYNEKLAVGATPFLPLEDSWLGIIVTPWCMNIVLLPNEESHHNEHCMGAKFRQQLPSGQYEFIRAHHQTLGDYATCSVFSPMFEFTSQALAMQTADEVLAALFDEGNQTTSERQTAHEAYSAQREALQKQTEAESDDQPMVATEQPEISRRAFLTGGFRRGEERRL